MSLHSKRIAGLTLLISMVTFHSYVAYQYVPGIMNVWHNIIGVLTLLPIDGIIAVIYGLWSRDKRIAFTIGFLPSIIFVIVGIMQINIDVYGLFHSFFIYGGFAVGMGLMGFGGAKYQLDKKTLWLVSGFLIWLFFLLMMFGMGMD